VLLGGHDRYLAFYTCGVDIQGRIHGAYRYCLQFTCPASAGDEVAVGIAQTLEGLGRGRLYFMQKQVLWPGMLPYEAVAGPQVGDRAFEVVLQLDRGGHRSFDRWLLPVVPAGIHEDRINADLMTHIGAGELLSAGGHPFTKVYALVKKPCKPGALGGSPWQLV
jgi:hypothetical protein